MPTATDVLVTNAGLLRRFPANELRAAKVYAMLTANSATTIAAVNTKIASAKNIMVGLPDQPDYQVSDTSIWAEAGLSGVNEANLTLMARDQRWGYVRSLDPETLRILEIYLTGLSLSVYT